MSAPTAADIETARQSKATAALVKVAELDNIITQLTGAAGRFAAASPAQQDALLLIFARDIRRIIIELLDAP